MIGYKKSIFENQTVHLQAVEEFQFWRIKVTFNHEGELLCKNKPFFC